MILKGHKGEFLLHKMANPEKSLITSIISKEQRYNGCLIDQLKGSKQAQCLTESSTYSLPFPAHKLLGAANFAHVPQVLLLEI